MQYAWEPEPWMDWVDGALVGLFGSELAVALLCVAVVLALIAQARTWGNIRAHQRRNGHGHD